MADVEIDETVIKAIATQHFLRTGNKNQLGSVEGIVKELLPDIIEVFNKVLNEE